MREISQKQTKQTKGNVDEAQRTLGKGIWTSRLSDVFLSLFPSFASVKKLL